MPTAVIHPDDSPPRRDKLAFWVAVILSLAAHVAVGWHFADRPLGRIDPGELRAAEEVYPLVRRPDQDLIVDPAQGAGEQGASAEDTLAELGEALLMAEAEPSPEPLAQAPELALRALEEDRPNLDVREQPAASVEAPAASGLGALPDVSLPFVDQPQGTAEANPGSGADLAGALLAEADAQLGGGGESGGSGGGSGGSGGAMGSGRASLPAAPRAPEIRSAAPMDLGPRDAAELALNLPTVSIEDTGVAELPEHLDDDFDYRVERFDPPAEGGGFFNRDPLAGDPHDYFRVSITPKRSLRRLAAMPKDVVFLVDTSGSIPQRWVDQVIRGVTDALAALNEGDRFNIVLFDEKPAFFSTNGPKPANAQTLEEARRFMREARSAGYTDVNAALQRLLVRDLDDQRVYNLVFISDGVPTRGVMDTRELINLITRDNDLAASIYCVGVGDRQNRELLEFLAYRNKGFCVFAERVDDAAGELRDLLSRLRYPILKDVQLSVLGLDTDEVYPRHLPNIHQGERFHIYGQVQDPSLFTVRMVGRNGREAKDFTFSRDLRAAAAGDEKIAYQWAFWKLHHLYSELIRFGDKPEFRAGIDHLRDKFGLKTLY